MDRRSLRLVVINLFVAALDMHTEVNLSLPIVDAFVGAISYNFLLQVSRYKMASSSHFQAHNTPSPPVSSIHSAICSTAIKSSTNFSSCAYLHAHGCITHPDEDRRTNVLSGPLTIILPPRPPANRICRPVHVPTMCFPVFFRGRVC